MWIDAEKKKKEEKKKEPKKERKEEITQAVWVVVDLRKIITKTGKQMMFLKCEWFDYDFEVVIFPRDIDKFKDRLEIDKIVIVNWVLWINFEYNRKSVQARDIKIATISMVREQALDLWLFDNTKRYVNKSLNEASEEEKEKEETCSKLPENFDEKLEEKINENKLEEKDQVGDKYIIKIPNNAVKQDLVDLKAYMQSLKPWFIKIFITLKWQDIDTKISLYDLKELKKWEIEKWS